MVKPAKAKTSSSADVSKPSVNLVKFRGEYFPAEEKDFNSLREFGVVTFRIRQQTLDILKRTLLQGKKLIFHNWQEVFPLIVEQFRESLPNSAELSADRNVLLLRYLKSEDEGFQRSSGVLAHYLGRYGIRTVTQSKDRGDWYLTRIVCTPDPELSPSGFFGSPDQMKSPMETVLNLSANCRLKFSRVSWVDGSPVLELSFEDAQGGAFVTAFKRAFPLRLMGKRSAEETAYFFAELSEFIGSAVQPGQSYRARTEASTSRSQGKTDGNQK